MRYDEDMIAEARQDAAYDDFLRHAVKCADCGHLYCQGHHRATRTDPAYVDVDECPRCGCGDTIYQDEQCVAERLREPLVEALRRWGHGVAADRLELLDSEDVWETYFGDAVAKIHITLEGDPRRHVNVRS